MKPDKTSTTPLYIQIRDDLRASILSGKLSAGDKIPPVTALAEERGVTAATIRRALQDLTEEGLISSHVGRGTFVTGSSSADDGVAGSNANDTTRSGAKPSGVEGQGKRGAGSFSRAQPTAGDSAIAARKLRQSVTRSLNEMMNLAHRAGVIAFTRGIGDPDTVEKDILTRLAQKALSGGEEIFRDTGDPRGLLSLRKSIARLYEEQGLDVSPDQILVTSGSQQAVALVAQQAAENGSPILCETPCYAGVTNAFSAFGLAIETVGRDADGPDITKLPAQFDPEGSVFYVCPVLHNPTGTDISAAREKEISAWSREKHVTVLSDEIFRDLHPEENQPPSFLKSPGPDRAIVLGSLSKSFISGLRVGWIVTSEERVRSLTQIKKAMDLGCPPLMQGIAQAFLDDERGYAAHREKIRTHYGRLRDITLGALETHMPPGVTWSRPEGGFQLWITLPQGFSSVELFLRSVERGVAFLPGPLQDINNRFMNSFRLCYGSLPEADIEEGIRRLGETIGEYLADVPGDAGVAGLGDF